MIGTCLKSNWFRIPGVKQRSYHHSLFIESPLLETGALITFTVISNYVQHMLSEADLDTISNVNFLIDFFLDTEGMFNIYSFMHIHRIHTHIPCDLHYIIGINRRI